MSERVQHGNLQVATELHQLLEQEILPGTGVEAPHFWSALEKILDDFTPRNRALLQRRDELQAQIDGWHRDRADQALDQDAYRSFLEDIGYVCVDNIPLDLVPHLFDRNEGEMDRLVVVGPACAGLK